MDLLGQVPEVFLYRPVDDLVGVAPAELAALLRRHGVLHTYVYTYIIGTYVYTSK